jgi:hypothetical protein
MIGEVRTKIHNQYILIMLDFGLFGKTFDYFFLDFFKCEHLREATLHS